MQGLDARLVEVTHVYSFWEGMSCNQKDQDHDLTLHEIIVQAMIRCETLKVSAHSSHRRGSICLRGVSLEAQKHTSTYTY